jgi:hypothetical protein
VLVLSTTSGLALAGWDLDGHNLCGERPFACAAAVFSWLRSARRPGPRGLTWNS